MCLLAQANAKNVNRESFMKTKKLSHLNLIRLCGTVSLCNCTVHVELNVNDLLLGIDTR